MIAHLNDKLTAAQFAKQYVDVPFCELERGEVVFLTAGGWPHSAIVARIAILLGVWAKRSKRGRVLTSEAGVITQRMPDTVRGVDVLYISYRRVPKGKEPTGFLKTPPELAVEVIGKGQGWGKMVEKAGEYFALGVDRVWLVDPKRRTVHILEPNAEPIRLTMADTITDRKILPGFKCKVSEFFED